MKSTLTLPASYGAYCSIDLQKNKKEFWLVNGLAIAIMVMAIVIAAFFVPITALFADNDLLLFALRLLSLGLGLVVYMVLHELVHGIFIRIFSKKRAHYGFTGAYAFAGSDAYFSRAHYIIIALAPVVIWGVVLSLALAFVPRAWFWVVYFIWLNNISGAAGDYYVTVRMLRMPKDILVQDNGTAMTVFAPTAE